jgi:hypothetical protein
MLIVAAKNKSIPDEHNALTAELRSKYRMPRAIEIVR